MATIGSFTLENGRYLGQISTLQVSVRLELVPIERQGSGPDYRAIAKGGAEVGAAWRKTSEAGRAYLSVTLDDPSFAHPINANLIQVDDDYALIWSRPRASKPRPAA